MAGWRATEASTQLSSPPPTRAASVSASGDSTQHFGTSMSDTMEFTEEKLKMVISRLALDRVQMFRSLFIGLGAFSLILVSMMMLRILFDSWTRPKLNAAARRRNLSFLPSMHPAETFPLALSGAIAVQMMIFIGIQSTGLESILVKNCTTVSQVVLPFLFVPGYTMLFFGAETTLRSVRADRFAPRDRWATPICLACTALSLLATWIPSIVWRSSDSCFGSLLWWTLLYTKVIVSIIPVLIFLFSVMTLIIGIQLFRNAKIEPIERIAASRMFFYLILAIVVHALILPFYVDVFLTDVDAQLTTSTVGEIAVFGYGVVVTLVYMFLRANAGRFVLKPMGTPWQSHGRLRFFGSSEPPYKISAPVGIIENRRLRDLQGDQEKQVGLFHYDPSIEKSRSEFSPSALLPHAETSMLQSPTPITASPQTPRWPLPGTALSAIKSPTSERSPRRAKSSYSLFPSRATETPPPALPPTRAGQFSISRPPSAHSRREMARSRGNVSVTDVNSLSFGSLSLPRPSFSNRHNRDTSTESSATVQIGLRLSLAPAAIGAASNTSSQILSPGEPPSDPLPQLPPHLRRQLTAERTGDARRNEVTSTDSSSLGLPVQNFDPSRGSNGDSSFSLPRQTFDQPPDSPSRPEPLTIRRPPPTARPHSQISPLSERWSTPSPDRASHRRSRSSQLLSDGQQPQPAPSGGSQLSSPLDKTLPPLPTVEPTSRTSAAVGAPLDLLSGLRMNPVSPPKPGWF